MRLLPHGTKIGNATVIVDIIPKKNPKIRPAYAMKPSYITDHDTGNASRGANAEMHNRYIHNMASYNPRDTSHVSWHLSVDERFIYQHIPFDESAWHCGDGNGIRTGNRTSIGVEKCMNVDGDRKATEENAIALHVYLLKNVIKKTPANVVPHQHWSGKFCPAVILKRDGSFNPYRGRIQAAYKGGAAAVKPVTSVIHVVKRGESLSAIAKKYGTTVAKLQADNNVKDANFIYVGQSLKVTDKPTASKPAPVKPTTKPAPVKAENLVIDGYFGPATIKALQRYFGTAVDGVISKPSLVIKALQKLLGVTQDGYFGPATTRALQKRFGTTQDGVISKPSLVIKELQRRLNNGKL